MSSHRIDTVVVGGGQAGLAISYYLKCEGHDHVVLERASQAGNAWRNHRWASFTLNTPNSQTQLPGSSMPGKNPDAFATRNEIISYLEDYIRENDLPVRYRIHVLAVKESSDGFAVDTTAGTFRVRNVVVAAGIYQMPSIPKFKGALSSEIVQFHSDFYWKPSHLPAGSVLVIGSGQSGAQIAEELYQSGRRVYLSVSQSGRAPRRYRGKDIHWWINTLGLNERTVDQLKSPREKFASKPHVSGTKGGHTLNLHQFASDGVALLGRVTELDGYRVHLAHDLYKNLNAADQYEANLTARIDNFIKMRRLAFPKETLPRLTAGFQEEDRGILDLKLANVTSVIWATGYSFNFSMVRLPIFDADGYPIQQRGVTRYPGLYFAGLPWLHNARSGLFVGLSEDSEYIASHIIDRRLTVVPDPEMKREVSCEI